MVLKFSTRVYCDKQRKTWFMVYVFCTKALMREFVRQTWMKTGKFDAICVHAIHWKDGVKTGKTGFVAFYNMGCRMGVVAHEFVHAALYSLLGEKSSLRVSKKDFSKFDEELAWRAGYMTAQFWTAWRRHATWKKKKR